MPTPSCVRKTYYEIIGKMYKFKFSVGSKVKTKISLADVSTRKGIAQLRLTKHYHGRRHIMWSL